MLDLLKRWLIILQINHYWKALNLCNLVIMRRLIRIHSIPLIIWWKKMSTSMLILSFFKAISIRRIKIILILLVVGDKIKPINGMMVRMLMKRHRLKLRRSRWSKRMILKQRKM